MTLCQDSHFIRKGNKAQEAPSKETGTVDSKYLFVLIINPIHVLISNQLLLLKAV